MWRSSFARWGCVNGPGCFKVDTYFVFAQLSCRSTYLFCICLFDVFDNFVDDSGSILFPLGTNTTKQSLPSVTLCVGTYQKEKKKNMHVAKFQLDPLLKVDVLLRVTLEILKTHQQ